MNITKIKYNKKGEMAIKYEIVDENNNISKTGVECLDPPAKDFIESLRAISSNARELCELNDLPNDLTTISLSIKYIGEVMEGVVITSLYDLDGHTQPLVINSPYIKAGDELNTTFLDGELIQKIDTLIAETIEYIGGKRAAVQQKLAFR